MTDDLVIVGGWVLYGHNPATGESVWWRDNGDGTTTVRHDCDVEPLLEINNTLRLESEQSGAKFSDWVHTASVPDIIADATGYSKAIQQKDKKWVSRFLNDPDHRKFRTSRGRA